MKKKKDENVIALNAFKAARRKEEIEAYGKLISLRTIVQKSKKVYNRKNKHNKKYE